MSGSNAAWQGLGVNLWKWGFADIQQAGMGILLAFGAVAESKPRGNISMEWFQPGGVRVGDPSVTGRESGTSSPRC